jgi:enoyl-CoA hydratase
MVMTGDPLDAGRALDVGLVNEIVDGDLLAAGFAFAGRMTRHSLVAVRLARTAVRQAATTTLHDGLRAEVELSAQAYASEDAWEGVEAFLAKRPPTFHDR